MDQKMFVMLQILQRARDPHYLNAAIQKVAHSEIMTVGIQLRDEHGLTREQMEPMVMKAMNDLIAEVPALVADIDTNFNSIAEFDQAFNDLLTVAARKMASKLMVAPVNLDSL